MTVTLACGNSILIDDLLYERLKDVKIRIDKRGYPFYYRFSGLKRRRKVILHRLVLTAPKGHVVDHIDGNRLNIMASNLRVLSLAQNTRNRNKKPSGFSQYKGVYRSNGRFRSVIIYGYQKFELGIYSTEIEAAIIYDVAARMLDSAYKTNYPEEHRMVSPMKKKIMQNAELLQKLTNARHPVRQELPTGVSRNGNRFQAQIRVNGSRLHLGTFDSQEDAHAAYLNRKGSCGRSA